MATLPIMPQQQDTDDPSTAGMHRPSVDDRSYRYVVLPTNNLRVLLVHDPSSTKAACGVDVAVGQFQDATQSLPGLAHLVEHMLFMGTRDFPTENALDGYLQAHGGMSNAYTDLEHTVYYLEVQSKNSSKRSEDDETMETAMETADTENADAFPGAVARFASCFVHPTLQESSIAREVEAVHSEHGKNKQNDHWRFHQLCKTILGKKKNNNNNNIKKQSPSDDVAGDDSTATVPTTDHHHVYAQFGTGNLDTLQPRGSAALQSAVARFYHQYYKSERMTVCLVGPQSLDALEQLAHMHFGPVPSEDANVVTPIPPLQPPLPMRVEALPTRETPLLELQWPVREIQSLYASKPTHVLSHLLGHEGPGSLLDILRSKFLWVQELAADGSSKSTTAFSMFALQLELTDAGCQHIDEIIHVVYAYLDILKQKPSGNQDNENTSYIGATGIPEWVVDELQTTAALQFRFLSKQSSAADTASQLASNMQLYKNNNSSPARDFISGPYLATERNPAAVEECLAALRPDNMLVLVAHKQLQKQKQPDGDDSAAESYYNQVDPHYGTQYRTMEIAPEVLERWKSPTPVPGLRLPDRNDMLATDFAIKNTKTDADDATSDRKGPVCLIDTPTCRLWFKPDTDFQMPKVNYVVLLRTPHVYHESPLQSVLSSLWAETAHELCNEFSYAASMAGLYCEFANTRSGMEIHVSGYHEKAPVLLGRLVQTVQQAFGGNNTSDGGGQPNDTAADTVGVTPELFERIRAKVRQQCQAFLVAQPYQHAMNAADRCMEVPRWDVFARLECLEQVALEDLLFFARRQLLRRCQLEVLVHGNATEQDARNVAAIVRDCWQPHRPLSPVEARIVELACPSDSSSGGRGSESTVYQFDGWNPEDENSAVTNIYQMGYMDDRTNATLSLLHQLVREPAFGQLRTKEQLGYIVHSQVKSNGQCKSLLMLIQSESQPASYLDERIEVFWTTFRQTLVQMPEDEFQTNVDALCASFLEPSKNLNDESSRYWAVIANQTYRFTRLADLAAVAKTVTKLDVIRMFDRYIAAGSPYRRKLSVQSFGKEHVRPAESDHRLTHIQDPAAFADTRPLLASRAPVDIREFYVQGTETNDDSAAVDDSAR